MGERITMGGGLTSGLDLGNRFTESRVVDEAGEIVEAFRVRTTEPAISARLAGFPPSRVVLEVGTHSPWMSPCVARHGHETIVANPRWVRLIAENDSKSDAVGGRPAAAVPAGELCALHPGPVRAGHGSSPRQASDGGAWWPGGEEAGDRGRGEKTRGAAAPPVGDGRGV